MSALPMPTTTPVIHTPKSACCATSRQSEAMTIPVRLLAADCSSPRGPPPRMKKDAQAMNTTQTGTSMTSAVSHTATAPRIPMLSVNAFFSDTRTTFEIGHGCNVHSIGTLCAC